MREHGKNLQNFNDTSEIIYLTLDQILAIHYEQIEQFGGGHGVRDVGLLESALYRPQSAFGGEDLYSNVFDKAAVLGQSILLNHAFMDGNKRTAMESMFLFLDNNGITLKINEKEIITTALDIESKKMDVKNIANWLENHARSLAN